MSVELLGLPLPALRQHLEGLGVRPGHAGRVFQQRPGGPAATRKAGSVPMLGDRLHGVRRSRRPPPGELDTRSRRTRVEPSSPREGAGVPPERGVSGGGT